MKLKIESTETGEVFNMRMENRFVDVPLYKCDLLSNLIITIRFSMFSIDKLKFQVSLLIPIPPHDQIMLIGPPYKILDSLVSAVVDYGTSVSPIRS